MLEQKTKFMADPEFAVTVDSFNILSGEITVITSADFARYNRLECIKIEDSNVRALLYGQAVSAMYESLKNPEKGMKFIGRNANAFITCLNPDTNEYLLGLIKGTYDPGTDIFTFSEMEILDALPSEEEFVKLLGEVQTVSPGMPKISSLEYRRYQDLRTSQST